MIKVILETEAGRKVDLLPESMPVREALKVLQADPFSAPSFANGRFLTGEDLESSLRECCESDEVYFSLLQTPPDEVIPEEDGNASGGPDRKESLAMEKVCSLLCEALTIMNTVLKPSDEELPF